MLPGCTRVIVSHKPDAVADADWVIVLEGGRVVEEGRPEELLGRGGFFSAAHRLRVVSLPR